LRQLVDRIIDDAVLAKAIQDLPARSLGKLIDHVGLEDSGEIIALATAEQIEQIFDDDLWKGGRPGTEDRFDDARFVLWLRVMMEVGEEFTVDTIEGLPEDMVVLALQRNVLVVDIDTLGDMIGDGDDMRLLDKTIDSLPRIEFDEFMVIARRQDGWDTIEALLVALNERAPSLLQRLLSRCAAISADFVEDNGGLHQVLTSDRMLAGDVAAEREDRREQEGFVVPTQAASFLGLCRMTDPDIAPPPVRDPVTSAHFRRRAVIRHQPPPAAPLPHQAAAFNLEALIGRLEAITGEKAPMPRLAAPARGSGDQERQTPFERALADLGDTAPALQERRRDELAYLGNALVAGCTVANRPFRPYEAIIAAAATCNIGLERLTAKPAKNGDAATATRLVADHGADSLFRVGFALLHRDIVLSAAAVVIKRLEDAIDVTPSDAERGRLITVLEFAGKLMAAGKPWHILPHLDAFPELFPDPEDRALRHLLGECPLLAGTLMGRAPERYRVGKDRRFLLDLDDVAAAKTFLDAAMRKQAP
jgi:hypothetical protein